MKGFLSVYPLSKCKAKTNYAIKGIISLRATRFSYSVAVVAGYESVLRVIVLSPS